MQSARAGRKTPAIYILKVLIVPLAIINLFGFGLFAYNGYQAIQASRPLRGTAFISQNTLEEKYGLRVNLVAVTGAGGFVDLRLKIVDGEKLKLLLSDAKNFPVLVAEGGAALGAPEDTKSQKIEFISGGNLFIMYPNAGNAVKQGAPVTLLFGDIALEPINAK